MPNIDLVVFDIAGTLIHDTGFVLTAFKAALREYNCEFSAEQLHEWRGASKREALRAQLAKNADADLGVLAERLERTEAAFRASLHASFDQSRVRIIDGVEPTFAWLRERNVKIALNTGFDRSVADAIMQAAGWHEGIIGASVCSDEVTLGRPAPYMIFRAMEATGVQDVRHVIAIGDTVNDLLAGWNAGVGGVIGVLTGSHNRERLGQAPHTHIIESVANLTDLMKNTFI